MNSGWGGLGGLNGWYDPTAGGEVVEDKERRKMRKRGYVG